ncbi:MAG: CBS domain-containing protein [Candidatus Bathyarchaeia archaeon]
MNQILFWASIEEAAKVMRSHGVSCLMVKRDSDLFGIITERDLVKALAEGRLSISVGEVASKPMIVIGPKTL